MSRKPRKNATELLRQVRTSQAQLAHEFAGVTPQSSLPITGPGGTVQGHAPVHAAGRRQLELYTDGDAKLCGNCKFWELEAGRQKMIKERFLERVVREQEWALRHLGGKLDELGLCGQSNGTMVAPFATKACDQWRKR